MNRLVHWFHHLFNPHCDACADEALTSKACQSCETLKMQLSIANHEKQQLLESVLSFAEKPTEVATPTPKFEGLPKAMTWNVRRQMLEAEDRKSAQLLAEQRKAEQQKASQSPLTPGERGYIEESIKNLEIEMGLGNQEEIIQKEVK